jgi:adiponectin receptor
VGQLREWERVTEREAMAMESAESTVTLSAQDEAAAAMKGSGKGGGKKRRRQRKGKCGERKKYTLVSYHELPDYMKENEFILNYYRSEWPILNAVLSVFSWHNETINIWT